MDKRRTEVTLNLPNDLADELERVLDLEPEFLDRIVLQAIIRRGIYAGIRDRMDGRLASDGMVFRVEPIEETHRRLKAENRHHDGGAWAEARGGRDAAT